MSSSIWIFVLNMTKNADRLASITNMLDDIDCYYSVVEAIDGTNMENDEFCKDILSCRTKLLNTTFKSIAFNQEWKYDGSIKKSFPGLNLNGHYGTKGLTLSNLKAFQESQEMDYKWFCILEDDAVINKDIYKKICTFLQKKENVNTDIVLLDKRTDGWGGTAGVIYNKNKIDHFLEHLHPLSNFSIHMETKYKKLGCVWDWKLWAFIEKKESSYPPIKIARFPCIDSGRFVSTIDYVDNFNN